MRRPPFFVAALVGLVLASACGASVSAVYEGDVRFERCMALDWQQSVDPNLRERCWEEWMKYFTLGQTRDRTDYARQQIQKLRSSSVEPKPLLAVPEPTSVFAPPPMMLSDAGPPTESSGDAGDAGPPSAKSECESTCDARADECRQLCKGAVCDKSCAAKHARCLTKCEIEH